MNDKEFIAQRIEDLEESVRYFSSDAEYKREGERWVAESFIENLHQTYQPDEIVSADNDPPDVVFRDAKFEIKEIMDEGRRRHGEYKDELKRIRAISDAKDLLKSFRPKTITIQEVYEHCKKRVESLDKKYPLAVKADTDLLLYVNLQGVTEITEHPYPDVSALESAGWRSISFVDGQRSCCLYAHASAPDFIRQAVGHISHLHQR
jgi:hypothetical protein